MLSEIIMGDCFEKMKSLADDSISLILTDPPYNISRDSNFSKGSKNKKYKTISLQFGDWDKREIDLEEFFFQSQRILKKGGTMIIFYDIWKSQTLKLFADKYKFKQPRVGQWVKTNPVPVNSKINYLSNAIEYFFLFTKGKKNVFNSKYDHGIYNFPICHGLERTSHPTQKPLNLMESLILKHSSQDDMILDPFAGSGTTGVACRNTNRNFILIENNFEYYNIIINRLQK